MAKKKATEADGGPPTSGEDSQSGSVKAKEPTTAKAKSGATKTAASDDKSAPAASAAPESPARKKPKRPGHSPRRGRKLRKRLRDEHKKIAAAGAIALPQALEQLRKFKRSKFDETVEIHMSLGVDVTQSDQIVRGTVALPHGTGKEIRLLVFCQGENVDKATEAGADFAGGDELIQKIQKEGWLAFDRVLATQDMMGKVSRLGKVLGPRGLMPTPKAGTVITGDVAAAVQEFKAGKVEYRTDKSGNIHAGVGKVSFDSDKLVENITTFVETIKAVKPSGVRGQYIKSVHVSATMSAGIPISV